MKILSDGKISLTVIFIVLISFSLSGQSSEPLKTSRNKFTLKWSPLHLIAAHPTFQLALEHRITKNISFQYEGGIPLNLQLSPFLKDNASPFRGFKSKIEVRRYFNSDDKRRFYCATEVFYNRIHYNREEIFIYNPNMGNYTTLSQEPIKYGMRYHEGGVVLKLGVVIGIKRFCIDIHSGIAYSYLKDTSINEPQPPKYTRPDDDTPGNGSITDIFNMEDSYTYIYPTIGLRIGYRLSKL